MILKSGIKTVLPGSYCDCKLRFYNIITTINTISNTFSVWARSDPLPTVLIVTEGYSADYLIKLLPTAPIIIAPLKETQLTVTYFLLPDPRNGAIFELQCLY